MRIILIGIFTACICVAEVKSSEQHITAEDLAQITGYPSAKIILKDVTLSANEKQRRKNKPECILHHVFSSQDVTFSTVSVAIGKSGTLLTHELDKKAKELIENTASTPSSPVKLRQIDLGHGIRGYSGLGMAGGGGSIDRSVVTLREYDRDIQVTITFTENALKPLEGLEEYQRRMSTSEGVNAIIEKCLIIVSGNLITSLKAQAATKPTTLPLNTQPLEATTSLQETEHASAKADDKFYLPTRNLNQRAWWLVLFGITVIICTVYALYKHRR